MDKKTFVLSANIEEGIAEDTRYIVTPNVLKVVQEIVDGYKTGIHSYSIIGTYGTGKSSFLINLEHDLTTDEEYHVLLKNKDILHKGDFEILNILGDSKPLDDLMLAKLQKIMVSEEKDTLMLLKSYYNRLKKKNRFLVIAIDEFGKVLEHAAKYDPEKELYFFQKLTEIVNAPTRNILLLTTLHQNFSAYASKLNKTQKNEWTKVKGRFKEIVFAEPVEQLLYLAAEHLSTERCRYNDAKNGNFRDVCNLAVRNKFVSSDFAFDTAARLFPLDTFSAYSITRAIQRYGQNERSLFTFLNAKGKNSIQSFVVKSNVTYNLSDVYDYVQNNFYSYLNDANSDSTSWKAIGMSIERIEGADWKDSQLMLDAIKIVKAIGIMNLYGNAGFFMNNTDMAEYASKALGIEYANTILHELIRLKIIRFAE